MDVWGGEGATWPKPRKGGLNADGDWGGGEEGQMSVLASGDSHVQYQCTTQYLTEFGWVCRRNGCLSFSKIPGLVARLNCYVKSLFGC